MGNRRSRTERRRLERKQARFKRKMGLPQSVEWLEWDDSRPDGPFGFAIEFETVDPRTKVTLEFDLEGPNKVDLGDVGNPFTNRKDLERVARIASRVTVNPLP